MLLPTIVVDIDECLVGLLTEFRGWKLGERCVRTVVVVIVLEFIQFSLKVEAIPERHVIKILTPDGANDSFDKWMEHGDIRTKNEPAAAMNLLAQRLFCC